MSDSINVSSDPVVNAAVADATTKEVTVTEVASKKKKLKKHAVGKLRMDLVRNPRTRDVYEDARAVKLARNIWKYGLQASPVVNVRATGEPWVCQGHRRLTAILMIRTKGVPAGRGDGEEAIPATPNFMDEIECVTYEGLTLAEEMDLLMDHGGVVLLNDQEKILAAIQMTMVNYTHAMIADKLGMSRPNYTNGIGKLLQLPEFIVNVALETDEEKRESLPALTQPVIKELHRLYTEEQEVRGSRVREAGPKLLAKWEEIVKNGATPPIKTLPRKAIENLFVGLSKATDQDIIDLLQAIRDGNAQDAGAAINRIKLALKMAGDTVGTSRQTIEEGIIKPVINDDFTAMKVEEAAGTVS